MPNELIPAELLNPARLLANHPPSTHPFYVTLGVFFVLLLVGSLVAYALAPRLLRRHVIRVRYFRYLMTALAIVGGLGAFWVLCRMVGAPLFAYPLWLWVTLLSLVGVLGYALYYWRRRYPAKLSADEETMRRRRWMPTPRKRTAARRR